MDSQSAALKSNYFQHQITFEGKFEQTNGKRGEEWTVVLDSAHWFNICQQYVKQKGRLKSNLFKVIIIS